MPRFENLHVFYNLPDDTRNSGRIDNQQEVSIFKRKKELSSRQIELLELLAVGYSVPQAAEILYIASSTAKHHIFGTDLLDGALDKLRTKSIREAVVKAVDNKTIDISSLVEDYNFNNFSNLSANEALILDTMTNYPTLTVEDVGEWLEKSPRTVKNQISAIIAKLTTRNMTAAIVLNLIRQKRDI